MLRDAPPLSRKQVAWFGYVAAPPAGGELVMIGRTRDSLYRNVLKPMMDRTLFGELAKQVRYTNGASTAIIMGREVHIIGANDALAEPKVRGLTCAGAYVDEATTLPQEFFDQLVARCSVPGAKIFATTNPGAPGHWFRKQYLLRPDATRLKSWHFTLDDNPALDPEYVAALKATYTGLWYRRFILGEWCLAEGVVWDSWDENKHVVDILPAMQRWMAVGVDYGTSNPFAALLLGQGIDNRLYVASEYRHDSRAAQRQLTDAQYSTGVQDWLGSYKHASGLGVSPEWIFVDPSAASFITQLWSDGVGSVARAKNDVLDGIRSVGVALGSGIVSVHRSCEGLITEVPGYAWDDKASERGEDKPLKVDDHSCDALRYALHSTAHDWRHLIRADLTEAA